MNFFSIAAGKKVIDAFQGGHYLDALQAAIDLQNEVLEMARKFDGVFGIKLNAVSPEIEAEHEAILLELKSLTCPVMASTDTKPNLDPASIIAIIQGITMIMDLIKKWREQKNG